VKLIAQAYDTRLPPAHPPLTLGTADDEEDQTRSGSLRRMRSPSTSKLMQMKGLLCWRWRSPTYG